MLISRIGIQSKKNFQLAGWWVRFAAISDPRFPDYIPEGMRVMAVNSGPQIALKLIFGCLAQKGGNFLPGSRGGGIFEKIRAI